MLIKNKHTFIFLCIVILTIAIAIIDLKRQQNLAKEFAYQKFHLIASKESILNDWELPSFLLGSQLEIVDTDYIFEQWVVTFGVEDKGIIQVFVAPLHYLIIPILNFKDDFKIQRIEYIQRP